MWLPPQRARHVDHPSRNAPNDDDDGDWRAGDSTSRKDNGALEEAVIKTGYLWKKGERRKVRVPNFLLTLHS